MGGRGDRVPLLVTSTDGVHPPPVVIVDGGSKQHVRGGRAVCACQLVAGTGDHGV